MTFELCRVENGGEQEKHDEEVDDVPEQEEDEEEEEEEDAPEEQFNYDEDEFEDYDDDDFEVREFFCFVRLLILRHY